MTRAAPATGSPAPLAAEELLTLTLPRWVLPLRRGARDGLVTLAALGVGGLVVLALAWRGAAAEISVPLQVPWLASGSLVGLALVGVVTSAWTTQHARRTEFEEGLALDGALDALASWVGQVRSPAPAPPAGGAGTSASGPRAGRERLPA